VRPCTAAACAHRSVDPRDLGSTRSLAEFLRGDGRSVRRCEELARVAPCRFRVALEADVGGRAAEPGEIAFGGGGRIDRTREPAAEIALLLAELPQRRAERRRAVGAGLAARAKGGLDDVDRSVERVKSTLEPLCRVPASARRMRSRGAAAANAASAFAAFWSAASAARSARRDWSASVFASSASEARLVSSSSSTASAVSPANQSSPRCGS
jgi:hypothetical protein